ncbi:MAG: EAL domain-containing protein [Undibacterium sp.]|nr:EAL domain-containing protein [Undibacterium sp.]
MNHEDQDDVLRFIDEETALVDSNAHPLLDDWNILIIDDDPDVHSATMFALNNILILGRKLHFLHAYGLTEARQVLLHHQNIAVILLDVVMGEDDTGLKLVDYIRNTLALTETRIILRTGQAGYAPEMEAIRDYDINDYKSKTELTQAKLYTTVASSVRSYHQIRAISTSKRGLEHIIHASTELMTFSNLTMFAQAIITQVNTLFDLDTEPSSLVCLFQAGASLLENSDRLSGLQIITGSGAYADREVQELKQNLPQFPSGPLQALIQKAFFEKRHLYHAHETVLYVENVGSTSMAVYLQCGVLSRHIDPHLVDMYCSNVSVCLNNVLLKSHMHNLAFFDPLTGLANRLQLLQNLQETLQSPRKSESVLALIDIDHFAETNDALGHQFGDFLLSSIGKRLQSHFGEHCQIARIGNDIFALLGHEVVVSPEMILALFAHPFIADQQQVQLSATLGLVKFSEYELSGSEALKDANIALKKAKAEHRSSYSYFTRDMGVEIRERVRMMHALRTAFDTERLFVVYQPQVNMLTGLTMGAEALLRWQTNDGKFISPNQFIPIAEYSGLIINIGEWVLRSACFELVKIREHGYRDFRMAINVSQAQFSHPLFLQMIERALRDSKAPPHQVELEITESMAMTDPEILTNSLQKLKALGMRISIDDFGTGFSSLSQLQKLNVDKLKIDRAFVSEISRGNEEASIAKMIVQLSQSLNLEIIAEGVETEEQKLALLSFGCNHAQGFLYSKGLDKNALLTWLDQGHGETKRDSQ